MRFTEIGAISVWVPAEDALAVLWDISSIPSYEPKVDTASVRPAGPHKGTYSAAGHFAGVPWSGTFTYQLTHSGFYSKLMPGALGVGVLGGFVVTSESAGRCVIAHYERYDLPSWLSPLSTLARPYLRRAMSRELRALARLIYRSATAGAPPVPRDAPVGPFLNSPLFAANPRGRAERLFTKRMHRGA